MYKRQFNNLSNSSKVISNKNAKFNTLLDTAFALFTQKGIKHTSIQDIVDKAGVAKGTFYLYFKDKYELQDYLLVKTSHSLYKKAIEELNKKELDQLDDKVIFVIDYIIDSLIKNPIILNFIQKNLSLGLYSEKISDLMEDRELGLSEIFMAEALAMGMKNPEVKLFMIIELVSSTCFSSIVKEQPLPINEYKPFLFESIRLLINN